jgi:predicted helicase
MLSLISKSNDLNSFISNVKDSFLEQPDYSDKVGKIGEEFCLLYFVFYNRLFDVDSYYSRSQIPFEIKEKLNLEDKDRGTDGIIEHTNGKFSFVQSKFRTNIKDTLTRDSISNMTLESFGSEKKYIQNLYLFSTVIKQPKELSKSERSKIKFILYSELLDINWKLFQTFVINVKTKKENISGLQPIPELYEHQIKALEISKDKDLLTLICACGGGKTLSSYLEIKREIEMTNKNVLVLVPSLYLVSQNFREFSLYSDLPKLLIGSDYNDEDNEKYNFPFHLTTDKTEILEFLKENGTTIIISTYQSCDKIYSVLKKNKITLGLTIVDEAHLTASTNKEGCFTLVLKEDFPTLRKIFFTATSKVYKGKNDECYSMDDEKVYGKSYNILPFREAIRKEILSDYKIMIGVDTDNKEFKDLKVKGLENENGMEYDISARECIMLNMIKKDLEEDYSRILVCSNSHKKSNEFFKFCKEQLPEIKMMLMGKNATSYHKDKATAFLKNNKKCIIFQVKIFNLGVHIREITTVSLLDDKSSTIDIVQTIKSIKERFK